jgi:hypothetical protein
MAPRILTLRARCRWVVSFRLQSLYTREDLTRTHLIWGWWAPEPFWVLWSTSISPTVTTSRTTFHRLPRSHANHYTDHNIPAFYMNTETHVTPTFLPHLALHRCIRIKVCIKFIFKFPRLICVHVHCETKWLKPSSSQWNICCVPAQIVIWDYVDKVVVNTWISRSALPCTSVSYETKIFKVGGLYSIPETPILSPRLWNSNIQLLNLYNNEQYFSKTAWFNTVTAKPTVNIILRVILILPSSFPLTRSSRSCTTKIQHAMFVFPSPRWRFFLRICLFY